MAPKPTQQQMAKDLYLQTDKTQQEIADILNVNRRTIYLWVKNGKWAEMKTAAAQTPFTMQNDIHNHIAAINKRIKDREGDNCPTMQEVEMLRKLINMSAVINKRHTGAYIEAFMELTTYIYHKDVDLARKVTMHADNYVKGYLGEGTDEIQMNIADNIARVEKNLENNTKLEDPATPLETVPEPPATDQFQTEAPKPTEPTPTRPANQILSSDENNTLSSVPVSTSPSEANGISGHPCDNNGITPPPAKNSDNQLKNKEVNQPAAATPYPITNFSNNGITTPQWQNRSFIDLPANEVLGKG